MKETATVKILLRPCLLSSSDMKTIALPAQKGGSGKTMDVSQ